MTNWLRNSGYRKGKKNRVTVNKRGELTNGVKVNLYTRKRTPKGCKAPRRVCLICRAASCDQRASWYAEKICPACKQA